MSRQSWKVGSAVFVPKGQRGATYMDIGQSGTRVEDADGVRHTFPEHMRPHAVATEVVTSVLERLPRHSSNALLISLSGLRGRVPDVTPFVEACLPFTDCELVGVCDDGLAWNLGLLSNQPGVTVAAGGGVVVVAHNNSKFVHLDGNGPDFGDSGGAFWLGREGIRAALRAFEGCERPTALSADAINGLGALETLAHAHLTPEEYHGACIGFAIKVLQAAEAGDLLAKEIAILGSEKIAMTALAAMRQSELGPANVSVALAGGLMKSELYSRLVRQRILDSNSEVQFISSTGDAIAGLKQLYSSQNRESSELIRWWIK